MVDLLRLFKSPWLRQFLLVGVFLMTAIQSRADIAFRGFSNAGFTWDQNTASNSFQIHDFEIFAAGQIDKNVDFITELNFQPRDSSVGMDLERSFVRYTVSPWFKVSVGRFHTALGYWNDTFHHGTYLQTAIERPLMERFEDSGGLLPVHTTGIEFRGNGPWGDGNLGYTLDIGNGRGPVKDPSSFYFNYGNTEAISEVVYYEWTNGLRVGENIYLSQLPGGSLLGEDSTVQNANCSPSNLGQYCGPKGSEAIYGFHVVYNSPKIEWLSEYEYMFHKYSDGYHNADGSRETYLNLFYSQFGYHLGAYTPYVRYELDQTNTADAYLNANPGYQSQGLRGTQRNYVAGVRYELSPASALKGELTVVDADAPVFFAPPLPNPKTNATDKSDTYAQIDWSFAF